MHTDEDANELSVKGYYGWWCVCVCVCVYVCVWLPPGVSKSVIITRTSHLSWAEKERERASPSIEIMLMGVLKNSLCLNTWIVNKHMMQICCKKMMHSLCLTRNNKFNRVHKKIKLQEFRFKCFYVAMMIFGYVLGIKQWSQFMVGSVFSIWSHDLSDKEWTMQN